MREPGKMGANHSGTGSFLRPVHNRGMSSANRTASRHAPASAAAHKAADCLQARRRHRLSDRLLAMRSAVRWAPRKPWSESRRCDRRARAMFSRSSCRDLSEIARFAIVENWQYRLLESFTPGPYAFVLRATREVPRRSSDDAARASAFACRSRGRARRCSRSTSSR